MKIKLFIFFFIFATAPTLWAQSAGMYNPWQVDTLIIPSAKLSAFVIPSDHLIRPQSLRVIRNHVEQRIDLGFRLTADRIVFLPPAQKGDTLRVRYVRQPIRLKRVYQLYRLDTLINTKDSLKAPRIRSVFNGLSNPFKDLNSDLQTRGSIVRGVNIGSNRDLSLNSGLNIELSGHLTKNMEVIAALTDESTPIQPEGNTQTLNEIDRVYVQFKSPFIEGTVGDINLDHKESQFGRVFRKLQGLTLLGTYKNYFAGVTAATTRGFFNRMTFIGQEGNQGPYQLTGKNGEREIIVLAGTEKVWVNGKQMLRGEGNDYIIEYANGQLTFTNRRLITGEARIEVDFEYFPASQRFSRNAYGARTGGVLFNNKLSYELRYFKESDAPDKIIGGGEPLSDADKKILRAAGNDFRKAVTDGAKFIGTGKGSYVKADTSYLGKTYSYFRYVGREQGDYSVTFTDLGQAQGDYVRDRLGQYRWTGPGTGNYLPVKLLPLPQKQQLTDLRFNWAPAENLKIESELALSNFDLNTFSTVDDGQNSGNAWSLKADAKKLALHPGGWNLGDFDASVNIRLIDDSFRALDRFNQADYQRYWNILNETGNRSGEKSIQLHGTYRPATNYTLGIDGGFLSRGLQKTNRLATRLNFLLPAAIESGAKYELINSRYDGNKVRNTWRRLHSSIAAPVWLFKPGISLDFENRRNQTPSYLNGFRFDDYGINLALFKMKHIDGYVQYHQRRDKVYDVQNNGALVPQSQTATRHLNLSLKGLRHTTASLDIILRKKNYSARFKNIKVDTLKLLFADASVQDTVWQDRSTNLAELRITHSHWKNAIRANAQYRLSTQQTALREKVYIKVQQGRGNLRFDPDLNEYVPDPDGDYVLFVVPSGKFEPVTKINSAFRLNFDPGRYWRREKKGLKYLLSQISGVSYFRVNEETKEKNLLAIYLLNLSKYQGAQTLKGSIVYDQDLYILKRNRALNFRLQYRYRDDRFNQFLDPNENEDRLTIEKGFRTDWRITPKIKSQTEIRLKNSVRSTKANALRNRDIAGRYVQQLFSYRPVSLLEFRLDTNYGLEKNRAPEYPLNLWFVTSKLQTTYSFKGKGRLTGNYEFQKVNVTSNPLQRVVPFEMARGKKEGISQRWQLRAEYTVSKNIVFTLLYTGRFDAGFDSVIHTGQAEVRAFF